MSESPAKRRKLRASCIAARKGTVTWPRDIIPMEIFSLIISFLSRSNVQNMRLVSKEFEEKVAHDLFQTVVVPFSPEIYGIAEEPVHEIIYPRGDKCDNIQGKAAVMLQDKGMRVFQGFGRHIHRFGMSFEVDYQQLTKPPVKSDQEAITTFWGIYRWPFKKYNRYTQLEGLEDTADETRTMAKALRFICNAKELALSIDGGLGWLPGPDINPKIYPAIGKYVVFGESRFRPEEKSLPSRPYQKPKPPLSLAPTMNHLANSHSISASDANDDAVIQIFTRILREAGYKGADLEQSVRTLMESEGVVQPSTIPTSLVSSSSTLELSETTLGPNIHGHGPFLESLLDQDSRIVRMTTALRQAMADHIGPSTSETVNCHMLKPNDLTNAQKEMLLEIEWAQRAFMQSYAIAIIDNPTTFQGIETLSIARLPSRHLAILRRKDFWNSLSQLRKVSLAIIPDWRDLVKRPESWVDDVRLPPSHAILGVYQLLNDYIAPRESIKSLHFEWLCGGEEAPGLFARNQHILAAPLVPRSMDMLNRTGLTASILSLPYIEHLTLKNCWASPHILGHFASVLRRQALKTLTFSSMSLSAPAPRNVQPGPVHIHHPQHHIVHHANANFQAQIIQPQPNQTGGPLNLGPAFQLQQPYLPHNGAMQNHPVQPHILQPHTEFQGQSDHQNQSASSGLKWLDSPRVGSWAHLINQITPGHTLASLRYIRDLGPEPPALEPTKLKNIVFHSCGYIRLLLDFDQTMLDPPNAAATDTHAVARYRNEIEQYMMKPQEHTLGVIINHINDEEARTLVSAWNLQIGWGKSKKIPAIHSVADGIRVPGQGRFRGKIESLVQSPS